MEHLEKVELRPEAPFTAPFDLMPLAVTKILKNQMELKKKYKEAMALISTLKARPLSHSSNQLGSYHVAGPSSTNQASKACWNCKAHGLTDQVHHYTKCPNKE